MNRIAAVVMLAFSASMLAQTPQLHSSSTVYIEPMGGYETYLAAAMVKKHVPLVIVADKEKAEFIIRSTNRDVSSGQPSVVVNNRATVNNGSSGKSNDAWDQGWALGSRMKSGGYVTASIAVIEVKSSRIVFAYSNNNSVASRTAESCAKHLKEFIEKPGKH